MRPSRNQADFGKRTAGLQMPLLTEPVDHRHLKPRRGSPMPPTGIRGASASVRCCEWSTARPLRFAEAALRQQASGGLEPLPCFQPLRGPKSRQAVPRPASNPRNTSAQQGRNWWSDRRSLIASQTGWAHCRLYRSRRFWSADTRGLPPSRSPVRFPTACNRQTATYNLPRGKC